MLFLPLWGICTAAILTIFMPLVADVQGPSISLLQEFSKNVSEGIKTRLGISSNNEHIPTPSARRMLTAVRLPPTTTPVYNFPIGYIDPLCPECPILGPDGFIWPEREISITVTPITRTQTQTVTDTSLASVTPFKETPTTHSSSWSFSSVSSLYSAIPLAQNLPKPASLMMFAWIVAAFLGIFQCLLVLPRISSKKSEEQAAAADPTPAPAEQVDQMKDLGEANVVIALERGDAYLDELVKDIEAQAESHGTTKDDTSPASDIEPPLKIVEYLYVEEEGAPEKRLVSVKPLTITKSEFESKYGCAFVAHTPTVVPDCHVESAPAVDKSSATPLSSDNGGLPVPGREDSREPSIVVSDRHVEGTPVVNLPSGGAPEKPVVVDAEVKEGLPLITLSPVPDPRLEPGEDSVPPTPPEKRRRRRNRMGQRQRRRRREEAEAAKLAEEAREAEEGEMEEGEEEEVREVARVVGEIVWF